MDLAELRALYDEDQRKHLRCPGMRREETPRTVRYVNTISGSGAVLFSALDEKSADDAIREEIAAFERYGQSFEWKLYSHDEPVDIRARLAAHGFRIGDAEVIVVLETGALPERLAGLVTHDIRRLRDPDALDDIIAVRREDDDHGWTVDQLREELRREPDQLSIYVAYDGDVPVAAGWTRFAARSPFASLWGGTTRETHRRHGFYSSLLAVRAQEAAERGARFLTVDAGPMSLPILKRLGFRELAVSYPCTLDSTP
ncbi:MAG: N-acetyltransferase [Planctomycetota bacterium]|nr:N-acetyltransferase [Planctomycetota bacterium]